MISLGAKDDVDRAVAAARAAFVGWSETPPSARADLLEKLADIYDSRIDEMAAAISLEMGAPITMARKSQARRRRVAFARNDSRRPRLRFRRAVLRKAESDCRIFGSPSGVCALITPWNWPDESSHAQSRPRARGRVRRGVKAVRNRAVVVAPFRRDGPTRRAFRAAFSIS